MRRALLILIAPVVMLVAACGSTSGNSPSAAAPAASAAASTTSKPPSGAEQLSTRSVPGVGTVLVDGKGRTLYAFAPDRGQKVTCVGGCAAVWPPLGAPAGSKPGMSGQVKGALVASDVNPSGGRVVTYAGWPLYLYVGDTAAGTAHGQGLNANGGYWWAITPAGKVVKGSASSSSGASTTSSGGGGGSSYGY